MRLSFGAAAVRPPTVFCVAVLGVSDRHFGSVPSGRVAAALGDTD
jgi:hypothetical protein